MLERKAASAADPVVAASAGATRAVVQVGSDGGRGFIVAAGHTRYIVTAAHCVGRLPSLYSACDRSDITYPDFIGPLGGPRHVWAECVFIDPISDIAVFCEPDNQELPDQAQAYEALTEQATPFRIGKLRFSRQRLRPREVSITVDGERRSFTRQGLRGPRKASSDARMQSLAGEWFSCRVTSLGRSLWFDQAAQPVIGGMSGSPIVLPDGAAVGVVSTSEGGHSSGRTGGPNPMLAAHLPG
jgi:Trypsin-like peptidase domain